MAIRQVAAHADSNRFAEILTSCAKARVNVLITGPAGRGKSTLAEQIALNEYGEDKVFSVVCPEDSFSAELRGHWVQGVGGVWTWHDGPVMRAVRSGGAIILDELDKLSPEGQTFLHAALDRTPITLPSGETVRKVNGKPYAIATMNSEPGKLREPLLSRFEVRLHMSQAPDAAFDGLPAAWRDAAKKMLANDVHESLRSWYAVNSLVESGMSLPAAADLIWPGRGEELATALALR